MFELERRGAGNNFTTIGTVPGSTNTNHLFTYINQAPLPGTNFYRLKIRERNGDISCSQVLQFTRVGASISRFIPTR